MKSCFILIAICFIFCVACRQRVKNNLTIYKSSSPVNIPYVDDDEIHPSYQGGMTMLFKYLSNNVRYPKKAFTNKIEGRVVLNFIVEKDGMVSNIKVIKKPSIDLSNEAVRVLMEVRFLPGKVHGKPVRVNLQIPFVFQLNNQKRHS